MDIYGICRMVHTDDDVAMCRGLDVIMVKMISPFYVSTGGPCFSTYNVQLLLYISICEANKY